MIYKITDGHDTIKILEEETGWIVFDLEPEVYPSDISVSFKGCNCGIDHFFGMGDDDEYCDECGDYIDGTYVDLVIQGDKVLYRRP